MFLSKIGMTLNCIPSIIIDNRFHSHYFLKKSCINMDLHKCGDCQSEFDSYENFLIHKLLVEQYTMTIEPSERIPELQLPRFVKINSNYGLEKEKEINNSSISQSETINTVLETFHCEDPLGTPVFDIEVETEKDSSQHDTHYRIVNQSVGLNNSEISPINTVKSIMATLHRELPGGTQYGLGMKNEIENNLNISHTESVKSITKSLQSETLVPSRVTVYPIEVETEYDSIQPEEASNDNISLCSQTESLRIDEGILDKEISSPFSNCPSEMENENNQEVYCKLCNRYYKNRVVLRVHEETVHSSARPHTCLTCHQSFKTKGSLVRHTRIHTGERPFSCSQCKKAFLDSGTLARHVQRIHLKQPSKQGGQTVRRTPIEVAGVLPSLRLHSGDTTLISKRLYRLGLNNLCSGKTDMSISLAVRRINHNYKTSF